MTRVARLCAYVVAVCCAAPVAQAQHASKPRVAKATRQSKARRSAPTTRPAPVPPRVNVIVAAADSAPSDSLLIIVTRDLELGDQVHVLPRDSASLARLTLRIGATPQGVDVVLADSLGAPWRQGSFVVVPVPAPRDSIITDSVYRAFAARDSQRRDALARSAAFRDSVERILARKRPHFWTRGARKRYDADVAARKGEVAASLAQDSAVIADARLDAAARDSARAALVARDRVVRDSLAAEHRWSIHGIADAVHGWITTHDGIAQSRIAYSADDGTLHVVDFDGANDHVVARGSRALSPAWRHDGRVLAFSDLADAGTQIGFVDLATSTVRFSNATPRGLNITPQYSPDDRWLMFATAVDGGTRLVAMRADSAPVLRYVATASGYDAAEPTFRPDGDRIAYVSLRGARPQIYSVNRDGTGERPEMPLVKGDAPYRAGPDWSPDGRFIAFEQQNGDFQVWLLDCAAKQMRRLTTSGQNEDPTWAPDSRHVAITSDRAGVRAIWILDVPTGRFRRVSASAGRLAAWSPRIAAPR